ncbi:MAG TPA: BTAD domain-containing putative transcriptional regulator [Longimicrobiales bacterium]|nr:BTAD domain-containing putative transcriptional regulator [Longimicrobiales bacterium]
MATGRGLHWGRRLNRRFPHRQPGVNSLLYLRLLGGLVLEEEGAPLTGRAAQKRRLALLALLAGAPGRSVNRNRITGVLWPDKDDEQARHLLSVAAYEIRKEVGEDAIVSRGEDLVLDPLVVGTDLDDFESALEREDYDAAIALYRGPFLDGFFVTGSSEFDHWTDGERNRYDRLYRNALTARAEALEARGDLVAATDAWRKAANADRFDSRIALRLLRALDAAGNRAGALQFARIHEMLLKAEFGTEPDPAFTAAVEEVRNRTEPAPQPAPRPAPQAAPASPPPAATADPVAAATSAPARSRPRPAWLAPAAVAAVLILVALAAYMSDWPSGDSPAGLRVLVLPLHPANPEDEAFADGLSESIMDALAQVDGVRVPAWSLAVALRGVSAGEAARRAGVDYVLGGSVRRDPGADSVRIRVELSTAGGDAEWNESYDRSTLRWRATWDEIARAVLREMEVELSQASLPDPAGDTGDREAREMFLKGRHAWYKRTKAGMDQALAYFELAVQRDPNYAQAHAGLADVYNLMGAYDYGLLHPDSAFPLARREAELALKLAPRLGEAYAALASVRFGYDRDWEGAERDYQRAIRLKPHYAEAHHWYSLFLLARGREEAASEEVRQAIQLDTLSPVVRTSLARHRYFRGDVAGALQDYEHALRMDPSFGPALVGGGVTLLELGRHDEALDYFRRATEVVGGTHPLAMALSANAHGRAGRPDEARAILARLEAIRATGRFVPPEWIALVHLGLGDHDAAIDSFEAALHNRSNGAPFFGIERLARPLWDHPRFKTLIARGQQPVAGS